MPKAHASLSPKVNALLIFVWAMAAGGCLLAVYSPVAILLAVAGAVLGVAGGFMQHRAFMQALGNFSTASTLMGIRGALKATTWGARYLRFLYLSKFVLIVLAFALIRQPLQEVVFAYLGSYFSLMCVRESITLRDTIVLQQHSARDPGIV